MKFLSLLYRWSPAIFWCATAGLAILLLHGFEQGWFLLAIAIPAFVALMFVRRQKFKELGIGLFSISGLATDIATSGAAGFAPIGSGTFGAVAALPLGFFLAPLDPFVRWGILVAGTAVSLLATHRYLVVKMKMLGIAAHAAAGDGIKRESPEIRPRVPRAASAETKKHSKDLDPSEVVVDESIGVLLALAFVPWDLLWAPAAFILFRAFDITKPGPVGWAERQLPGAWGVVFDDVIAGLMAGAVLALARWLPTVL